MTDAIHYLKLTLTNIRSFGGRQTLDLSKDGKPSRWCVILGENGVGKTTLMQALAVMRPFPAFERAKEVQKEGEEAGVPKWVEPALADYENNRIISLVRDGNTVEAALEAELVSETGGAFSIGYGIVTVNGELVSAEPKQFKLTLTGKGPLVIAYSAFRHAGHKNLSAFEDLDPTESLFDEHVELVDPNEVAETLDHAALSASRDNDSEELARSERLQAAIKVAIAALIPGVEPNDIELRGSRLVSGGGIRLKTPSGTVPLAKLSLGAQTMIAWLVDLAWRLYTKFPLSSDPFGESAIVLIDEVELHLHPIWQRSLREQLLKHFPKIQFIVTTHAPVTAQESVAAGDPISIVRWEGDHSVILPDPLPAAPVRLDEVVTGLFEMDSSLPKRFEELLLERRDLIRKDALTSPEKYRLADLNRFAHAVQSGSANAEAEFEKVMAGVDAGDRG